MSIRVMLSGTLLLLSVVVTTALMSRLAVPGATPDLVLVSVLALALAGGSRWGLASGFAGGLLLDLAPPAVVPVGTNAFALCLVGAVAGRFARRPDRGVGLTLAIVGGAAVVTQVLRALLGLMARDGRVDGSSTLLLAVTGAAYAILLAPFVVPAVGGAFSRVARRGSVVVAGRRR